MYYDSLQTIANKECFLDCKPAVGLDAKSMSDLIIATLQNYGLDAKSHLVGQGYDGASVMSGANKGEQKRVRDYASLAIYIHCYAHRLNLILVDCCESNQAAVEFFALSEKLYVFTSSQLYIRMEENTKRNVSR